ncbi:unnamed protein product [Agarophyton chilense]
MQTADQPFEPKHGSSTSIDIKRSFRSSPERVDTIYIAQSPRRNDMATVLREIARRSSSLIVKSSTPQAWETTSQLRSQYIYTTMDCMPARVAEAKQEWAQLRHKVAARHLTVNDLGVGVVRALEMYGFYLLGRVIGSRSLTT